ncbi:MAG: sulfatase [Lawsonibacter sp.]|jgi:arylsulfatase
MKQKNVVFIMADQLRKDYVGCYGNPYVRTPNLDWIAQRGMRFDQCFVNNPICMPNRMSLFTGRYPHNHGMWTNGLMLPHSLPTLADQLGNHGYHTCSIGKLHFEPTDCGPQAPMGSREDHRYWKQAGDDIDWYGPYWGFDHVELTVGHATTPIAHYGKWFHQHGGTDDMAQAKKIGPFDCCGVTTMPEALHDSLFVGERSAAYIQEHAKEERPFFLLASFPDPHHPFNPPYETAMRYQDTPIKQPINEKDDLRTRPDHYRQQQKGIWHRAGLLKKTPDMTEQEKAQVEKNIAVISEFMDEKILEGLGLLTRGGSTPDKLESDVVGERERDQRIRNTYAMVDLIDQGVGKILEALRQTGTLEDTILVFTSDHGELMGDHGMWLKGPFFYDGLINVPLLISVPGMGSGSTKALTSSVDVYPTLCQLLGVQIPRSCDGVSQVPALAGGQPRNSCIFEYRNGYFESDVNTMGYLDADYKFVQYQTGECELTDRKNDLEENVNLAADPANSALVEQYREKLLMAVLNTGNKYPDQISHA